MRDGYAELSQLLSVAVIRNGQRQVLTAKTMQRPDDSEDEEEAESVVEPVRDKLGLTVQNITPELRRLHSVPESISGVLVTNVKSVSPAGDANIRPGEVISEVQGQRVTNTDEFRAVIDKVRSGQRIRMYVTTPTPDGQSISTYRLLQAP